MTFGENNSEKADGNESVNNATDFPNGGIDIVHFIGDYAVTDLVCEECNGTRGKITHVFRMSDLVVGVGGEEMSFAEFSVKYPLTATQLSEGFHLGEYVNPTCTACQEDMRMKMKDFLASDKIGGEQKS